MEIEKSKWEYKTKFIWTGVLVCFFANILAGAAGIWAKYAPSTTISTLYIVFCACLLCGIVIVFTSLLNFRSTVDAQDRRATMLIAIGYGLSIAVVIFLFIERLQLLNTITGLAGNILLLKGFYDWKESTTFPHEAVKGAGIVYSAYVVAIIGNLGGEAISVSHNELGVAILLVIQVISLTMQLIGWYKIKNAVPSA